MEEDSDARYDIRVVDVDGDWWLFWGITLNNGDSITLHADTVEGIYAEVKTGDELQRFDGYLELQSVQAGN